MARQKVTTHRQSSAPDGVTDRSLAASGNQGRAIADVPTTPAMRREKGTSGGEKDPYGSIGGIDGVQVSSPMSK